MAMNTLSTSPPNLYLPLSPSLSLSLPPLPLSVQVYSSDIVRAEFHRMQMDIGGSWRISDCNCEYKSVTTYCICIDTHLLYHGTSGNGQLETQNEGHNGKKPLYKGHSLGPFLCHTSIPF